MPLGAETSRFQRLQVYEGDEFPTGGVPAAVFAKIGKPLQTNDNRPEIEFMVLHPLRLQLIEHAGEAGMSPVRDDAEEIRSEVDVYQSIRPFE